MKTNIILKVITTIVLSILLNVGFAQNAGIPMNTAASPSSVKCEEPTKPAQGIYVLEIDGSTYKNSCIRSGGQYLAPGGCAAAERAWKRGSLFACTNPPGKIPYHDGDVFKCSYSEGILVIEISTNTAMNNTNVPKCD